MRPRFNGNSDPKADEMVSMSAPGPSLRLFATTHDSSAETLAPSTSVSAQLIGGMPEGSHRSLFDATTILPCLEDCVTWQICCCGSSDLVLHHCIKVNSIGRPSPYFLLPSSILFLMLLSLSTVGFKPLFSGRSSSSLRMQARHGAGVACPEHLQEWGLSSSHSQSTVQGPASLTVARWSH